MVELCCSLTHYSEVLLLVVVVHFLTSVTCLHTQARFGSTDIEGVLCNQQKLYSFGEYMLKSMLLKNLEPIQIIRVNLALRIG